MTTFSKEAEDVPSCGRMIPSLTEVTRRRWDKKKTLNCKIQGLKIRGGEAGIRTLDALVGHTHLAGEHLRPLGHFSTLNRCGLL